MTTARSAATAPGEDAPERSASYAFVPASIEQQGRSANVVMAARLCDSAKARLKGDPRKRSYRQLRKLFRDECAGQDGYLSAQHPVLETVLRILLAAEEDSMTLDELHGRVEALWLTSTWPRHINIDAMRRVLDRAQAYGSARA